MNADNNKIICPVCNQQECFKESENNIDSYLCVGCGYTTTSLHVLDSITLRKYEQTTAELIKGSRFIDTATNLVWYPSVLNFPTKGIIFPDGTNESNWKWRVAHMIAVKTEDQEKYPIPGKKGEFYKNRIDMEGSKMFERTEFKDACFELGILEKV